MYLLFFKDCRPGLILILSYLLIFNNSEAKRTNPQYLTGKEQSPVFIENCGQLTDTKGKPVQEIKFYFFDRGAQVYCMDNKLLFVFTKSDITSNKNPFSFYPDKLRPSILSAARMELEFTGANPGPAIIAEIQSGCTTNYYSKRHSPISSVKSFKKLTYKNIYPKIDLVLNLTGRQIEYSFIVLPGGNPDDIKLRWNGVERSSKNKNGQTVYSNNLGEVYESDPIAFMKNGAFVKASLKQANNTFAFCISKYDESKTLVIDPTLAWASYYGGRGDDEASGIATDRAGNIFITGLTLSANAIATTGAFRTTIDTTSGSYSFVAKFNSSGKRLWATYYAGITNGISVDDSGNVYIVGYTYSSNGVATPGAFKDSIVEFVNNLDYDAFLVKFNNSGNRIWGTYYGGKSLEFGQGVATDDSGNVYISGVTESTSGIASAGAFQTSYAGSSKTPGDAFLAKFNSSGKRLWGTYYGGSSAEFQAIVVANDSGVYLSAYTQSDTNIATTSAYQTKRAGGEDVFIARFSYTGRRIWGTYYGGSGSDEPRSIALDKSGNIYLSGYTTSPNNIATPGAYDTAISGIANDYLAKFNSSGTRLWASYFGDSSMSNMVVSVDKFYNVYLSGSCQSTAHIATTSAHQATYGGGVLDAYIAKIGFNAISGIISTSTGKPLKLSKVYLCTYNPNDSVITVIDSTVTDSGGNYSFAEKDTSIHTVYIFAIPDNSYKNELPTWSDSAAVFQDANKIALNHSGGNVRNFSTLYGSNPGGNGFIGGKVIYCALCKTFGSGTPVAMLRILLADSNGTVQRYTYTDAKGNFKFSNISLNKYLILVDKPLVNNGISPEINLTTAASSQGNLSFTLYPNYLSLDKNTGVAHTNANDNISIYPDPANTELTVSIKTGPCSGIIRIKDISGQEMYSEKIDCRLITIDISQLSNGLYSLDFETINKVLNYKFIKQ